jgi:U3 small nucleolar RNA-associated protein 19
MKSVLKLVKDETKGNEGQRFANGTYSQLVEKLVELSEPEDTLLMEFVEEYLNRYYDLQYYFLLNAVYVTLTVSYPCTPSHCRKSVNKGVNYATLHAILSSMTPLLPLDGTQASFFTSIPATSTILRSENYKVAFQSLWLVYLRKPLSPPHLKQILLIIHKRITPYMNKPPLLMDFLTDAYNTGPPTPQTALLTPW